MRSLRSLRSLTSDIVMLDSNTCIIVHGVQTSLHRIVLHEKVVIIPMDLATECFSPNEANDLRHSDALFKYTKCQEKIALIHVI